MKHRRQNDLHIGYILYIPLRSDETNGAMRTLLYDANFISHYVQMKRETLFGLIDPALIFISHYVQMKRNVGSQISSGWSTLYPTTFR